MQASDRRDSTVIFLHIPKAAGTTLHAVLESRYPRDLTHNIRGPHSDEELQLANLSPARREQFRLIKGHLLFGIHRLIPGPSTYVTLLRHPVDRVVSHYYFVKRRPHHRLYNQVVTADRTLEQYVSDGLSLELNNGQVRALFGPDHLDVPFGHCSSEMLDKAMDNMRRHFSVVGIAERFDETLLWMMHELGWGRLPLYVSKNVTRNRPSVERLPAHVIAKIEELNALDLQLYENAQKSLADALERWDVRGELDRFRRWNGLYNRYAAPVSAIRSSLGRINGSLTPASHG